MKKVGLIDLAVDKLDVMGEQASQIDSVGVETAAQGAQRSDRADGRSEHSSAERIGEHGATGVGPHSPRPRTRSHGDRSAGPKETHDPGPDSYIDPGRGGAAQHFRLPTF